MKILHIQLGGPFTENMSYQENMLTDEQVKEGYDVSLLVSCKKWNNGKIVETEPEEKILDNGVKVTRVEFKHVLNKYLSDKIRYVSGIYEKIKIESPDLIYIHGPQTLSGYEIVRYCKDYNITLIVDSHEDFFNSANNFISANVLHKIIYKHVVKCISVQAKKILCVSLDTIDFMKKMYGADESKMEYFPLGGHVFDDNEYLINRYKKRKELNINDNNILFIHSGKLSKSKKTDELLKAFTEYKDSNAKLVIIGSLDDYIKIELEKIQINDKRISYLGWKDGDELQEYLCAADVYVQPGTQSATLHNAMCCRCAIMTYPYNSYKYLLGTCGMYISDEKDIIYHLDRIHNKKLNVDELKKHSYMVAKDKLDYAKQAKRIVNI